MDSSTIRSTSAATCSTLGSAPAQVGGDRLQPRDLLADEEQQALAQQVDLAREVVGERAERDAGRGGDAAVGDGRDPLAADQLDRRAEDSLAGVGGRDGGQEAPALPVSPIVRSNEQRLRRGTSDGADHHGRQTDARGHDEMAFAGLREQAQLLQTGEASSRELVEAALERAEAAQPTPQRLPRHLRRGGAAPRPTRPTGASPPATSAPLLGVPVAIKDDVDLTGHTTPFGCGGGRPRRARRRGGAAPARGRRDRDRQDPRARGRPVALHRDAAARRHPQPLEHRPHPRRLQRRRRRGRRGRAWSPPRSAPTAPARSASPPPGPASSA